jgi:hypothetical protein
VNSNEYTLSVSRADRQVHGDQGTVVFRACFRQAKLPSEFIVGMIESSSSEEEFIQLFDAWLLKQILVAIGGATIA